MAKAKRPMKAGETSSRDLGAAGEYHLPIEPKPGRSAGSRPQGRRAMIILALVVGAGAALLVWWLGSNL